MFGPSLCTEPNLQFKGLYGERTIRKFFLDPPPILITIPRASPVKKCASRTLFFFFSFIAGDYKLFPLFLDNQTHRLINIFRVFSSVVTRPILQQPARPTSQDVIASGRVMNAGRRAGGQIGRRREGSRQPDPSTNGSKGFFSVVSFNV